MSVDAEAVHPTRSSPLDAAPSIHSDMTFTPIQAAPFANYVQIIERRRAECATVDEQLYPPSRPSSPGSQARTEALKSRIGQAVKYANHNPMSSRWTGVANLVKMASTSRRYCGVADGIRLGEKVDVDVGHYEFVLPDTEEEWNRCEERWEKRFEKPPTPQGRVSKFFSPNQEPGRSKADLVRDKVKAWQARVVPTAPAASEVISETDTARSSKGKGREPEPTRQSPLPFPVTKRHAVATSSGKADETAIPGDVPQSPKSSARASPKNHCPDKPRSPKAIADLSEMVRCSPDRRLSLILSLKLGIHSAVLPATAADVNSSDGREK